MLYTTKSFLIKKTNFYELNHKIYIINYMPSWAFFVKLKKTLKTIKEKSIFYSYQRGMEVTQTNCVLSKYS